jgi:hypothetical protein
MPLSYKRKGAIWRNKEVRKFIFTFLPASLLLAFLAMGLSTCGGGGGGGGSSAPAATLTGLSVNGPASVSEYGTGTYTATASWNDNSTTTVTPTWSVNSQAASISTSGVLSCRQINNDQTATITATYSSGGITETATMDVSLTNVTTIPFTAQMLSGEVLFEENFYGGGASDSYLFYHNTDSTYVADTYEFNGTTESSGRTSGSWSIDASGNLILNYVGGATFTVKLISDSSTEMQVVVDDGGGSPWIETLEKTVPVDLAKLPGTYVNNSGRRIGETWIFASNGTGSTTGDGGWTFTWSVDSGILKVVFTNGYGVWIYARATSQSSPSSYTILKWAFVGYNPGGGFSDYYGGMSLTRQ